jgi:hypothetical protein
VQFLAIFAAVATFLYLVSRLGKLIFLPIEERPEIRVRNRKLTIENDRKNWIRVKPNSDKEWKHDHDDGYSVESYQVTVRNSKQRCGPLQGPEVLMTLEIAKVPHEFKFCLVRDAKGTNEPVVISPVDLQHSSLTKKKLKIKTDPDGGITEVRVGGKQCYFPGDPNKEVVVRLQMIYEPVATEE